jgi:hypothetical protein
MIRLTLRNQLSMVYHHSLFADVPQRRHVMTDKQNRAAVLPNLTHPLKALLLKEGIANS